MPTWLPRPQKRERLGDRSGRDAVGAEGHVGRRRAPRPAALASLPGVRAYLVDCSQKTVVPPRIGKS
jgi:hypothetical protein